MLEGREIDGLMGQALVGCRVTRLVASGRTGVVVQATREADGRPVDIKVFHPYLTETAGFAGRFAQEAQAAIRRRHPNLQRVHSFGVDQPLYFIVMEHLDGESLSHWLAAHRGDGQPARREALARVAPQVGAALAALHGQGTSHGDLKPTNILLGGDDRVIALDAGVARVLYADRVPIRIGAPEYMAPEQVGREQPGDAPADQYALAVICYELLTGQPPFQGPTPGATLRMHASTQPPPPSALAPGLPARAEAALLRALAKEPAQRHPSVDAFLGELLLGLERPAGSIAGMPLTRTAAPPVNVSPPPPPVSAPPPAQPSSSSFAASPAPSPPAPTRREPVAPAPIAMAAPAQPAPAAQPAPPPRSAAPPSRPAQGRSSDDGGNLGKIVAIVITLLILGGTFFLLYLILGPR
jgi:serine/threonine-protein kinase